MPRVYKVSLPCGRGKNKHIHRTADSAVIESYVRTGRVCRPKVRQTWRLSGYDTFSGEGYSLYDDKGRPLTFTSLAKAEEGARRRLKELERTQPSSSSGGQGFFGIQDQVYIETPEGESIRFTG